MNAYSVGRATLLAKVKQQRRALPAFLKSWVGRLFWK
jgi:hypothetical protein